MKLIRQLRFYTIIIIFTMVFLAALVLLLLWVYKKKRNIRLEKDATYRHLPEVNSEEFVPLSDIDDQMIIEEDGKRFTAFIRCRGFDYYTSNLEEKIRTKNNYVAFISALTEPILYRLYGEDINMENTIKMYQGAKENLEEMFYNLSESYKEAQVEWEAVKGTGCAREEDLYKYLLKLQKKLKSYDWRIFHVKSQINYIGKVSGPAAGRHKLAQTYAISWQKPGGPLAEDLTREKLYKKAIIELDKECRNKIRQLNDAGVSAYRCSTDELIDMWHKHYHPISGNQYTMKDIHNSVYFDEIATTDSINRMNQEFEAELAEEIMLGGDVSV